MMLAAGKNHSGVKSHTKVKEFELPGSTVQLRPIMLARTTCATTRAHVDHMVILHSGLDGPNKNTLRQTAIDTFIMSNPSMVPEDLPERFSHWLVLAGRKACHEDYASRPKFPQVLQQCGPSGLGTRRHGTEL